MGIGVLQIPYDGLKIFTEVQRMARRAVLGEFEDVRLDAFAAEDLGETQALGLKTPVPGLAVGKYDDFQRALPFRSGACHSLGRQRLRCPSSAFCRWHGTRKCCRRRCRRNPTPSQTAHISPRWDRPPFVRSARVHHDEHGMRLCLIPRSAKPIAVAFIQTAPYYCGAFHVRAYG